MDMSLVSAALAAQSGSLQMQVATTVLKSNMDSEKSAVMTLLGTGEPNASSPANVAAGIGGNLDVTA
jgi:Putative motility protein